MYWALSKLLEMIVPQLCNIAFARFGAGAASFQALSFTVLLVHVYVLVKYILLLCIAHATLQMMNMYAQTILMACPVEVSIEFIVMLTAPVITFASKNSNSIFRLHASSNHKGL